jgi:hypothetical protein
MNDEINPIRDNLSYLAGLIDGEGHIGFYANGRGYAFRINIRITNEEVINWLHENFGGIKNYIPKRKSHWKDQWSWQVHGNEAIKLYRKIYPLLIIKRIYDLEPTINSGKL